MQTAWIWMRRRTRRLIQTQAVWYSDIFTNFSDIEALWKLKHARNVADDNLFGGLKVKFHICNLWSQTRQCDVWSGSPISTYDKCKHQIICKIWIHIFMPPRQDLGGILFLPCLFVTLFVCLSRCHVVCLRTTLTLAITFEPLQIQTWYLACICICSSCTFWGVIF